MAVHPAAAVPVAPALTNESPVSAVSWAAIFAGATTAVAISLLLAALGTGLGFASISAWPGAGASAETFSIMTAIWLVIMQWVASGMGGFVTGRLRTKWAGLHTHEVFFRDTAHGFVMWAAATVATVAVVALAAGGVAREGVRAASTVASGAAQGATQGLAASAGTQGLTDSGGVSGYSVDELFRAPPSAASNAAGPASAAAGSSPASASDPRAESARILAMSLGKEGLSAEDRTYLAQLVSSRTGLSQSEAEQRVDAVAGQVKAAELKARQAADAARKVAAMTSIFTALAMLIGAFIACVAAAIGGNERDQHT